MGMLEARDDGTFLQRGLCQLLPGALYQDRLKVIRLLAVS